MYAGVLVELLIVGMGVVSASFAYSWDPYPPTRWSWPAMIWGFVRSLVVTFYAMLSCYPREACSFSEGKQERSVFGEGRRWGDLGSGVRQLQSGCNMWEKNRLKMNSFSVSWWSFIQSTMLRKCKSYPTKLFPFLFINCWLYHHLKIITFLLSVVLWWLLI